MNTFTKKSLYAALAGVSALGATGAAQAVSVNPDGLGQVLIYPYYTVRDKVAGAPFASLLSVVNSTASAKAVKVRFLEGKNSREVLDFNLYLSRNDVWTAAVIATPAGAGIYTPDTSCTSPTVSSNSASPTPFVNFAYSGSASDGADTSLDRVREGYVEIIEMGDILDYTNNTADVDSLGEAVTHTTTASGWKPPGCDLVPTTLAQAAGEFGPGTGGLFGTMTLINVLAGEDFGVDAIALDDFSDVQLWAEPGSIQPNLTQVNPKVSTVLNRNQTIVTNWPQPPANLVGNPVDPVSAVLMHDALYNEFVVEAGTKSGTDWVVTMPTKTFYYQGQIVNAAGAVTGVQRTKLFQRNFGANGACDDVSLVAYDREERERVVQTNFSPPPPTQTTSICWEANVITFNNTNVFGSKNVSNLDPTSVPFASGWLRMNFPVPLNNSYHVLGGGSSAVITVDSNATPPYTVSNQTTTTFVGLPVVGFAAVTYNNGELTAVGGGRIQSQYGGSFNHKGTRSYRP